MICRFHVNLPGCTQTTNSPLVEIRKKKHHLRSSMVKFPEVLPELELGKPRFFFLEAFPFLTENDEHFFFRIFNMSMVINGNGKGDHLAPKLEGVRWSLVTLPTFWSLVTLPTSLGRVASDPFVLFLWPCSLKNTSHRILFWVVACDPTYLFGRVASDHFLALAIPKHLP